MKNYFDFTLTGKRLLPIWMLIYVFVLIPYGINYHNITHRPLEGNPHFLSSAVLFLTMLLGYLIAFFIIKMAVESIKYKEETIQFDGKFFTYVGKILLGLLLSCVTLFIYLPWFIKDIASFFASSSSWKEEKFQFMGKGGRLFVILLLTIFLPIIALSLLFSGYINSFSENLLYALIYEGILMIVMVPYFYYYYHWMVDVQYKNFSIRWETEFVESAFKILTEFLLIVVTVGIYFPLAYLRLFKYFSEKTVAVSDETTLRFGFDYDAKNDFFYIWGQMLLTMVTLGIYYPWAFSKIGKRVLSQTYLEQA
jgi:uncharacterized membrane protein YjgN (DUF898 family)